MTELRMAHVSSPIGIIALVTCNEALCALDFADREPLLRERLAKRYPDTAPIEAADPAGLTARVRAYLEGEIDALTDIPVETGGTEFQRRVWTALRAVPPGTTRSYGEIAAAIGAPGAARAVGSANRRNPIALAIPCHRVVSADRSLGGYAGGRARKLWLLRHEGATPLAGDSTRGAPRSSRGSASG